MNKKCNIVAMIPARIGSCRLKKKNLVLLGGKPLIQWAVEAAKAAGVFSKIVINSDSVAFAPIANRLGVEFYKRDAVLGGHEVKSDDVIHDFIHHFNPEILVWVNSIAPLQPAEEITTIIKYFREQACDSLITVKKEQVHCVYDDQPVNYQRHEPFARTQDLRPVYPFVYSIMMWRCSVFEDAYQKNGYGLMCGRTAYYPVSQLSSVIIKTEDDIRRAEWLLVGQRQLGQYALQYVDTSDA